MTGRRGKFCKSRAGINGMEKMTPAFFRNFPSGKSPWPARIFLCLAVLVSYASVWPNEFVFDDMHLIVGNDFLRSWSSLPKLLTSMSYAGYGIPGGFYRPVQMLIFFLIYQAFGLSAIPFHALSIALQALNACLLHHFGIKAEFKKGVAFSAALLWAVHPLHTINVAYAASMAELLWSSFCLLGLITLLPDFTPHKIFTAMVFFILALGCKESAVVFPALAAATLFFVNKDRARYATYLKTWPLWLLSVCFITLWLLLIHKFGSTLTGAGDPGYFQAYTFNLKNRIITSLATLPVYAWLIVWPVGLHVERVPAVSSTLFAWLPMTGALMAGLGLLQILRGRVVALSFGILWFAIALSPYTGILVPIDAFLSEGWMYMPTMGLFLGVTQTAAGFFDKSKNAAWLLVLALAFALGSATFIQVKVWRNTETLYQSVLQNGGYVARLSDYLGLYYMEHSEFDKAVEQFQYVLDKLGAGPRVTWATHLRLALSWLHVSIDASQTVRINDVVRALPSCQHIPEAVAELGKTLQDNPDYYWAHQALSAIYRYQGNSQMADFHLKQAEEILKKQGVTRQ
jgi:hypothetical protein